MALVAEDADLRIRAEVDVGFDARAGAAVEQERAGLLEARLRHDGLRRGEGNGGRDAPVGVGRLDRGPENVLDAVLVDDRQPDAQDVCLALGRGGDLKGEQRLVRRVRLPGELIGRGDGRGRRAGRIVPQQLR